MIITYQTAEVSFKKLKEIGQKGQNSEVYLVHDEHLDAELAVKQVKTDGFNEEHFLFEAQTLYKSSHPNVVPIHYACKDKEHIYIAMPFYKNGSLGDIAKSANLSVRQIVRYAVQFLSGLNNVHSKGLVHFDIKPDNILISDNNEALLSDFGYTKNMDESGFTQPTAIYTIHLPPEVTSTSDLDNRSDIYQVGLTLYRLIVGDDSIENQRDSFSTGAEFARAQKQNKFPDPTAYPPHIPSELKKIISNCLKFDPEKRYESVIDLLNDLSSISTIGIDWVDASENGKRIWVAKLTSGRTLKLEVDDNGAAVALRKTLGGDFRRCVDLCCTNVTEERIHEILMSTEW